MTALFRAIARVGFAGPLTLGMLGCSLLLAVALVVATSVSEREAGSLRLRGLVVAEAACLSAALALVVALVTAARRPMLATAMPGDVQPFRNISWGWGDAAEQILSALFLAGGTMVAVSLLLACAAAQWHVRWRADQGRAGLRGILAPLLGALLLGVTGFGLARYAWTASQWRFAQALMLSDRIQAIVAVQVAADAPLGEARLHILALALLGTAGLLYAATSARDRPVPRLGPAAGAGSALLFGLGLAAYVATRPLLADAGRPVPAPRDTDFGCPSIAFDVRTLPPAKRCDTFPDAPTLEIDARGAHLDGIVITAADTAKALDAKRRVFISIYGSARPLPPLVVLADARTRMGDVAPHLAGVLGGFGPEVVMATVFPAETLSTRTLGEISRSARCCGALVRLGAGGAPSSRYATWGDLARAAAEPSPSPLEIAP